MAPWGLLTSHTLGGYVPGDDEQLPASGRCGSESRNEAVRSAVPRWWSGDGVGTTACCRLLISNPEHALPQASRRHLTTDEVRALITCYTKCAAIATEAGLDGIEMSAAHSYLMEKMLDPTFNLRDNEYRKPTRALLEVIAGIGGSLQACTIGMRLSGDWAATRGIVEHMADIMDYVHVTTGNTSTVR